MKGIDISQGSGKVNFKALKSAGYEFIIARAGYGSSVTQVDTRFHSYAKDALAAGLHVGAYWFIYARTIDEAEQNAKCFLEVVEPYKGKLDMPLYIDYEYDSTRYYEQSTGIKETKTIATGYIKRAAEVVEAAGFYSGVYLNPDYMNNHVNYSELKAFTLWLAQWEVSKPSYNCGIWQSAGDTEIAEAGGGVDLNQCYVDFPTIIRRAGLNGFTQDAEPQASDKTQSGDRWEIVHTADGMQIKLGGAK